MLLNVELLNSLNQKFEFKISKDLWRKILRVAQFNSEIELGVNPLDIAQAKVSFLSQDDFGYIDKVDQLVEEKIRDLDWVTKTLNKIAPTKSENISSNAGIKFNDELFKGGRGILQRYLKRSK